MQKFLKTYMRNNKKTAESWKNITIKKLPKLTTRNKQLHTSHPFTGKNFNELAHSNKHNTHIFKYFNKWSIKKKVSVKTAFLDGIFYSAIKPKKLSSQTKIWAFI